MKIPVSETAETLLQSAARLRRRYVLDSSLEGDADAEGWQGKEEERKGGGVGEVARLYAPARLLT